MDTFSNTERPQTRYVPQLAPARERARSLEAAGFGTKIMHDARDSVSVYVDYNGLDLGRINVWISGYTSFHEVKVEAAAPAIRAACSGDIDMARSLAAETVFTSLPTSWTAYVASAGVADHSAFGITMMNGGVVCGGAAGDVDASEVWAGVEGTIRIVTRANANKIDRMTIRVSPEVVKYADGSLESSSPYVARLKTSLKMGTEVTLAPHDPLSEGCRLAKRRADSRLSKIQMAA